VSEITIITLWLIGLTESVIAMRITYLLIQRSHADESEYAQIHKRIKHAIIWAVICACAFSLQALIRYHYFE
jgi:uncharacterized membrane-anchored protein